MNALKILSFTLSIYMMAMFMFPVLVFKHQQYIVRKEMKAFIKNGVPEDKRIRFFADELESDSENLHWIHDKEFRYRGEMYDILAREYVNNRLVYVCIHDVKESGLFAKLDAYIDNHLTKNLPLQQQRKCLQQFVHSLFFEKFNPSIDLQFSHLSLPSLHNSAIPQIYHLPDAPPPEIAFTI